MGEGVLWVVGRKEEEEDEEVLREDFCWGGCCRGNLLSLCRALFLFIAGLEDPGRGRGSA